MEEKNAKQLRKIGKRIQSLRRKKNLTQKDLAFILNVEISQITRIERGIINTSILNILFIAKALNVSLEEMFKDIEV